MASLPSDPHGTSFRRPSGSGRALSRRHVKKLVAHDQIWVDLHDGRSWRITGIHRKDGLVRLQRDPGSARRFVTFGELGKHYVLNEAAG